MLFKGEPVNSGYPSSFTAVAAADVPVTISGVSGQTGDLLQLKNSAGTVLLGVAAGGTLKRSVTNTITALAGGGQAGATALTAMLNRITTVATQGDSVALPASVAGLVIYIDNQGASACQVYGAGTDTINGVATATGIAQAPQTTVGYTCYVAGNWETSAAASVIPAKFVSINVTVGTLVQGNATGAAFVSLTSINAVPGTQTTRTATQMFNDTPGAQSGQSYVLRITQTGAGTLTLGAGAGVTLTGTMTVPVNTFRDFIVTFNTATTLTIQAVGTGTFS